MSEQPTIGPNDWHLLDTDTMPIPLQAHAIRLKNEHAALDEADTVSFPRIEVADEADSPLSRSMDEAAKHHAATLHDLARYDFAAQVREGTYSPRQLGRFTDAICRISEASTEQYDDNGDARPTEYETALDVLAGAPTETLQAIYFDDTMPGSATLRHMVRENINTQQLHPQGRDLLLRMHGLDDLVALKGQPGIHHEDPTVQELTNRLDFPTIVLQEMWDDHGELQEGNRAVAEREMRDRQLRFLQDVVGLTPANAQNLQFASLARTSNDKTGFYDMEVMARQLDIVSMHADHLGADTLNWLQEKHGMINLDTYSTEMMRRMAYTLSGDRQQIDYLQAGDVTVVLRDVRGDYNNALSGDEKTFDTRARRTLMFEINQPTDLYRHVARLKQLGVLSSTIVLSVHGQTGQLVFGDNKEGSFAVHNHHPTFNTEGKKHFSMFQSKGLRRLVRDYMQPARDPADPADRGRQRVILAACKSDVEWDVDRPTKRNPGRVQSESMAYSFAAAARSSKLDVYGAPNSFRIDLVEDGARFRTEKDGKNVSVPVSKLKRDKLGRVVRTYQDELILGPRNDDD